MIFLKPGGRHLLSEEGSGLGEDSPDSESPEPSADCAPTYFCNAKEEDKLYEEEQPQQTFKRRMKGYAKSHADPGCIRKSSLTLYRNFKWVTNLFGSIAQQNSISYITSLRCKSKFMLKKSFTHIRWARSHGQNLNPSNCQSSNATAKQTWLGSVQRTLRKRSKKWG